MFNKLINKLTAATFGVVLVYLLHFPAKCMITIQSTSTIKMKIVLHFYTFTTITKECLLVLICNDPVCCDKENALIRKGVIQQRNHLPCFNFFLQFNCLICCSYLQLKDVLSVEIVVNQGLR